MDSQASRSMDESLDHRPVKLSLHLEGTMKAVQVTWEDVLVVHLKCRLLHREKELTYQALKKMFPKCRDIIILDDGDSLTLYRPPSWQLAINRSLLDLLWFTTALLVCKLLGL